MRARQRPHRELDPRGRRALGRALAAGAAAVVVGLLVVGLRVQHVHLAYRLDALRAERARLEALIRELEVEVATLRAPGRVEQQARRLGLTAPAPAQVRLAREFVPGGTGLARQGRVVAAGELAAAPPGSVRAP